MDKLSFLIFLTLCGGTLAKTSYYMDMILHSFLPQEAKNLHVDPARLANFTTESEDKITFIHVKVKMSYYSGQMTGLLKARRDGECSPIRNINGNSTINCTILFNDVKFDYQAKMKYGQLPTANVKAHGKMSPTRAVAEVTTRSNHKAAYLKHLKLTHTGSIEAKFTGLGPLNSQLKKLTEKAFIGHVTSEFVNVFTNKYFHALARAVTHILMPPL